MFVRHRVDVSFYGHIHSYNRMYPVKGNGTFVEMPAAGAAPNVYRSPSAPVHMMVGMAGAGHLGAPYATPKWSALHLEFVANGDGLEGEYAPAVHDEVWITKQ